MLAYLVLQVTQRQRSEEPPSVCLALLAILEALHTLAQPLVVVLFALLALIKLWQVRHLALNALLASMAMPLLDKHLNQ